MRALIFANGLYEQPVHPVDPLPDDLVIAADGGSRHCQELELVPDIIIGDLDSAQPELIAKWEEQGAEVIRYPEDKDQTDLELAVLLAQQRGAVHILVYGAVGGRLDMTIGNLTLLGHPELHTPTTLICGRDEVHLLKAGEKLPLIGQPEEIVSLIPLQPGPSRVSASGVAYPLDQENLFYGTTRGISNYLVKHQAEIVLESGLMAVVHRRTTEPEEGKS